MKPRNTLAILGLALGMMAESGRAQITIPMVMVEDAGNSNDSTGFGAVPYTYAIGTTEVNLNQYTAFLNAVAATDTYGLYNTSLGSDLNIAGISRSGSSGSYTYPVIGSGLHPVTYVSWFDAARFANWVANGQPVGAQGSSTTEDGAYTLLGATSGVSFTKNANNPNTSAATTFWLPSENEWYKAAYYDPGACGPVDDYWLYPTRSDSAPGNTVGAGTNQANYFASGFAVTQSSIYSASQNYLTDGGAFSYSGSFYGAFDQGGNVWEWNDAVIGSFRGLRGGSWFDEFNSLQSSNRAGELPSSEFSLVGFRVAGIPEPSTTLLIVMAGGAWMLRRRLAEN